MQRQLLVLAATVFLLSGCAALENLREHGQFGSAVEEALVFQERLAAIPPEELAAIGQRLRPDAGESLNRMDSLRYALWLSTPGHPGHDPAAAQRRLTRLIDEGDPPQAMGALIRTRLRHLRAQQTLSDAMRANFVVRTERQEAVNDDLRAKIQRQAREIERLQQQIEELTKLERRMGSGDDEDGSGQ